jgi:hypothetical protein
MKKQIVQFFIFEFPFFALSYIKKESFVCYHKNQKSTRQFILDEFRIVISFEQFNVRSKKEYLSSKERDLFWKVFEKFYLLREDDFLEQ